MSLLFLVSFMSMMAFEQLNFSIEDINPNNYISERNGWCEGDIPHDKDIVTYYSDCMSDCGPIHVVLGHGVKLNFTDDDNFDNITMKCPKGLEFIGYSRSRLKLVCDKQIKIWFLMEGNVDFALLNKKTYTNLTCEKPVEASTIAVPEEQDLDKRISNINILYQQFMIKEKYRTTKRFDRWLKQNINTLQHYGILFYISKTTINEKISQIKKDFKNVLGERLNQIELRYHRVIQEKINQAQNDIKPKQKEVPVANKIKFGYIYNGT